MSGRNVYLVAYDICDPKRLRMVHRKMQGFGDALQYSIFQCDLSAAERQLMVNALVDIIHHGEDRILIVNLGRRSGRVDTGIQILGKQQLPSDEGPFIF